MSNHPNRGRKGPQSNPTPEEIRALREKAGVSQVQAARLVHRSERNWQQWELGERRMDAAIWALFRASVLLPCQYCGASPSFLVEHDFGTHSEFLWLCAKCDDEEMAALSEYGYG